MDLAFPERVGMDSSRLARVDSMLKRYVERGELAGMVAMAARHGKIVLFEKYGVADIEAGKSMELDTIFRLYSMTKPVTAVALMMLFEQGLVRLTDQVSEFLPYFKDMKVLEIESTGEARLVPATAQATIHDLLVHRAGLSYGFTAEPIDRLYQKEIYPAIAQEPGISLEELIEKIAALPLAHQPGTRFRYSYAYDVLGLVVQVVSGISLDRYFEEHIFAPLGMVDTAFWVPEAKAHRLASLYTSDEHNHATPYQAETPFSIPFEKPPRCLFGGGGLFSTAPDYYRFAHMLLNKGALNGERLLSRKTLELMTADHLPGGEVPFDDENTGAGLGVYVQRTLERIKLLGSVGSFGGGGAANTFFWIDPVEALVQVLMVQYLGAAAHPVSTDFNNLVYQAVCD